MEKIMYDGDGVVFGRLASNVAKNLLKGNVVCVKNCEKIIVSGSKELFAKKISAKRKMGSGSSMKGPKYPRTADRVIKRMIRGMLPWDRAKGRAAYKNLRCYVGEHVEEGFNVVKLNYKKPTRFFFISDAVKLLR